MSVEEELLELATPDELAEIGGFDVPSADDARRFLEEVGWGEFLTGVDQNAAAGECTIHLYSLKEAAKFFRFGTAGLGFTVGGSGSVSVARCDEVISWVRECLGDESLACALARETGKSESYHGKAIALSRLLNARYVQLSALAG